MSAATAVVPAVECDALGRRYRRRSTWALRDVSLSVHMGSVTALVGPNGAGKSTLLRSCVGFERPDRGRVLVCGVDPRRDRRTAVDSVGYVPQSNSLYRGLSIEDHLTTAMAAREGFDAPYARDILRRAGLAPERKVGQLSGGEQARVALALALGCRPQVLLLDEPLASLDPLARRDFLALLGAFVERSRTAVLLSSHIVTDVEQACDHLVILSAGHVALDSSIEEARRSFRVAPADLLDGHAAVGQFAGPDGRLLALHQVQGLGEPATLEEVTLGHLAARSPGATP